MRPTCPDDDRPIVMADVVRELQAFADAAALAGDPSLVDAARRAQSLLARLRNQFVFEVAGPGSPSNVIPATLTPANAA
jgi:hypothetical protein